MTPKGYSATQIALHWIVAILILSQYLLAEGMEEAWEVVEDGGQAVTTTGALIHILIGAAVFLFALWRLSLRFSRGAPGPAEGETGHAHGHLEYLEAVGDPATGLPIGDTKLNLKASIAGETHEYTDMYPGMAKAARDEGFDEIADWFETLAKAERSHANRFQKALDVL